MIEQLLGLVLTARNGAPLLTFIVASGVAIVCAVYVYRCANGRVTYLDGTAVGLPWLVPLLTSSVSLLIATALAKWEHSGTFAAVSACSLIVMVASGVLGHLFRDSLKFVSANWVFIPTMLLAFAVVIPYEIGWAVFPEGGGFKGMSLEVFLLFGLAPCGTVYWIVTMLVEDRLSEATIDTVVTPVDESGSPTDPVETDVDPVMGIEQRSRRRIEYKPDE